MDASVLSGKVAIVTGASSGIGHATAQRLARQGARVALVSRSREKLERLSGDLPGSRAFPADMTKVPQIKSMIKGIQEHFGRVDILVNNAGQGYDAPVEKIALGTLRYIYDLNVIGPVIAMQQVIPLMRKQGGRNDHQHQFRNGTDASPGDEPVCIVQAGTGRIQPGCTAGTGEG